MLAEKYALGIAQENTNNKSNDHELASEYDNDKALTAILLCQLVEENNLSVIEDILKCADLTNCVTYDGFSALHEAARLGRASIVQMLLSKGAKLNLLDRWSKTPMHYAIEFKSERAAKFLTLAGGSLTHNT